jgi:hypothetical protein
VWGFGPASLSIGPRYSSATASATLEAYAEAFDECTGEWSSEELPALSIGLDLTATSGLIKESGRGSFHLPGEINNHSSYKATYRQAEGSVDGADGHLAAFGQIGKVTWTDHTNG